MYDERWRIVATYRETDNSPKEQFVYHNAGNDGLGGASYIDDVILRDKDANTAWASASDGTLEDRVYYCQNWRHDVVALIDDVGNQVEQVRYTAYGIPDGLPAGDMDSDGDVDNADITAFDALIAYAARADLDLDGDNDSADRTVISGNRGDSLGFGVVSLVGNRKAYAGYEFDDALQDAYRLYHVRHRVLNSHLGRRISRDPLGYVDGMNLYGYVGSNPAFAIDSHGMFAGCNPHFPFDPDGGPLPVHPNPCTTHPWPRSFPGPDIPNDPNDPNNPDRNTPGGPGIDDQPRRPPNADPDPPPFGPTPPGDDDGSGDPPGSPSDPPGSDTPGATGPCNICHVLYCPGGPGGDPWCCDPQALVACLAGCVLGTDVGWQYSEDEELLPVVTCSNFCGRFSKAGFQECAVRACEKACHCSRQPGLPGCSPEFWPWCIAFVFDCQ